MALQLKPIEPPKPTTPENLQFDRAEFDKPPTQAAGSATCKVCNKTIANQYYEINENVVCATCKELAEKSLTGGSPIARFLKAAVFGMLAGAVGTAIWYAILKFSGYELGLIAIVVGFMVGFAVRKGSGNRGGWAYQALAMIITYCSIVATYVPFIIEGMKGAEKDSSQPAAIVSSTNAVPASQNTSMQAKDELAGVDTEKMSTGKRIVFFVIAMAFVFGIAFVAPVLAGIQNIIGMLIIGFAVYEAWKINKRVPIVINGPYNVAGGNTAPPQPAAPA
jgi:hypothetical protein